jgi:hypothetical protein
VEALLIITIAHYALIAKALDSQPTFQIILFFGFLFVYIRLTGETVAVFYPVRQRTYFCQLRIAGWAVAPKASVQLRTPSGHAFKADNRTFVRVALRFG